MKLDTVDYTSPDAPEQFVESLRNTGFGILSNHPIKQSTVESVYDLGRKFFASEEKHQYEYHPDTYDGYFPIKMAEAAKGQEVRDIKEYFQFYTWGQCPPAMRDELIAYYDFASTVAAKLLEWVELHSPPDVAAHYTQSLPSMLDGSEQSMLRVLHYPPLQGDEEPSAIRANAHEDINLLTLLPASNEPGLQVKKKDGTWFDVPCDFGNLIVNTGDMLQEASQGYFPSTTHRVVNPADADHNRSRISLPLFLHPNPKVVLSDRYTAHSYLQERLEELRNAKN